MTDSFCIRSPHCVVSYFYSLVHYSDFPEHVRKCVSDLSVTLSSILHTAATGAELAVMKGRAHGQMTETWFEMVERCMTSLRSLLFKDFFRSILAVFYRSIIKDRLNESGYRGLPV